MKIQHLILAAALGTFAPAALTLADAEQAPLTQKQTQAISNLGKSLDKACKNIQDVAVCAAEKADIIAKAVGKNPEIAGELQQAALDTGVGLTQVLAAVETGLGPAAAGGSTTVSGFTVPGNGTTSNSGGVSG